MSEFSRIVTQQMHNAREINRAIETHGTRIFTKMADLLKPYLSDKQYKDFVSDVDKVFGAQLRYLKTLTNQVGEVDLEHARELLETQEARNQRDEVMEETFSAILAFKQAITSAHGDRALALLGMAGQTPRVPRELERWLENVLNIAQKGIQLPPPRFVGLADWNDAKILQFLQPVYDKLGAALEQVSKDVHEDQDTLTRKWELMEKQNNVYSAIASMASAHARFCGEHDLADRLEPNNGGRPKRRSQQMEEGQEGAEGNNGSSEQPSEADGPTETPAVDVTPDPQPVS